MEWRAFIAACFYRKKVIGSTEFEDILGLIRVNFDQVRCTIRDNDGVICIQQDQKLKPRYCSIWVDKFNPNGSIYMQDSKKVTINLCAKYFVPETSSPNFIERLRKIDEGAEEG
ncbi:hypothetical protein DPMN_017899 [Dreissena polymorpha]|uniref:Uncharacterized protein n=1 Tax=Dreissena polymorpha TaxID=45954 RepID=A0A9D4NHS9_DREPO|nr:hypothetical protein DPMN_017899 [Dreissena polymorpha]